MTYFYHFAICQRACAPTTTCSFQMVPPGSASIRRQVLPHFWLFSCGAGQGAALRQLADVQVIDNCANASSFSE